MSQILVLMPEGKPGEPDWEKYGTPLGPIPDGTYALRVDASWRITEDGGSFRGGMASIKFEVEGG